MLVFCPRITRIDTNEMLGARHPVHHVNRVEINREWMQMNANRNRALFSVNLCGQKETDAKPWQESRLADAFERYAGRAVWMQAVSPKPIVKTVVTTDTPQTATMES